MSDEFTVNNPGMTGVTDDLARYVSQVLETLDQVNQTLARLPEATSNSGVAPWQEQQGQWNGAAADMYDQLTGLHVATLNSHQAYVDADNAVLRLIH
jgi:uncharacterized protein YukE